MTGQGDRFTICTGRLKGLLDVIYTAYRFCRFGRELCAQVVHGIPGHDVRRYALKATRWDDLASTLVK